MNGPRPTRTDVRSRTRPVVAVIVDLLPLFLLAASAAVRPGRLAVLAILAAGTLGTWVGDRRRLPAWAATLPVAVSLAWGLVPLPAEATDGSTCASPVAPFALWRVAERRRAPAARPSLLGGAIIAGAVGLLVGPTLAAPFFGPVRLDLADPQLLLPASAFALANGLLEELVYRGVLLAWTSRVSGPRIALVGQAIVFGLAHGGGPGVGGSPVALAVAMAAAGLGAGWIARRTRSLALPAAVHRRLDLPLYVGNASRIA